METIQDIINRCKTKQRDWWKHLRSEGWHLCSVCKKKPIVKDKTVCAFCDHKKRRFGNVKPDKPEHPRLPGISSAKEEPDDNK
jgi:hypothetical protein